MKNLVKLLALFALVIVVLAARRAFSQQVFSETPRVAPAGTVCLQPGCVGSSSRPQAAQFDPDINIQLRQFVRVPGTLNIIDFVHDTAPAPQLCSLFSGQQLHAFVSLYAVGVFNGIDSTKQVEQDPPHLAGFQVSPGESILTPPLAAYGGLGGAYNAIILHADSNSLTLKYTLDDDVVSGYTINIIGISIDPKLRSLYNQANNDGRWYLPAVAGSQVLGSATGQEIWVAIRDTGQFLDPRWLRDWWKDCPGTIAPKAGVIPTNPPGFTATIATPISSGGPLTTLPGTRSKPPIFLPLGSLETCPGEIPLKNNSPNASCTPTYDPKRQCVSECSPPIEVTENLRLFADQGCLRNGDCLAKIGIKNNALSIPFVKDLGNYFAGVLDAEHPDELQGDLREKLLQKSGVAKKLLPTEIQDKLKCDFIRGVQEKVASGKNTKYKDMEIGGVKIVAMSCDRQKYPGWSQIPLFSNEDSAGKIEFVSPSLFSTRESGNDPNYPKNDLGPIYISVPEVERLNLATKFIQKALIPSENITARETAVKTNPKESLPTFGQAIDPSKPIAACKSTNWGQYYNGAEYDRAVTCNLSPATGATNSKICVVGPDGQLRCYQQEPGGSPTAGTLRNPTQTVQVRTVIPNLFEIAQQTIQNSTGFLRIFKPKDQQDNFEKNFDPVPAASDKIQYVVSDRDITIKPQENGWQLYFYRLGGLVHARDFVLKLLTP